MTDVGYIRRNRIISKLSPAQLSIINRRALRFAATHGTNQPNSGSWLAFHDAIHHCLMVPPTNIGEYVLYEMKELLAGLNGLLWEEFLMKIHESEIPILTDAEFCIPWAVAFKQIVQRRIYDSFQVSLRLLYKLMSVYTNEAIIRNTGIEIYFHGHFDALIENESKKPLQQRITMPYKFKPDEYYQNRVLARKAGLL